MSKIGVNDIIAEMPSDFNTWFIDCDAYGELFDDYSPSHPATQLDDMQARLERIAWIRDEHNMVVGSEGGAAYAAATLHFAHGMMSPVIGWSDPEMKDKNSPYYIGGYWPPRRSRNSCKAGASQTALSVSVFRAVLPTATLPDCVSRFSGDNEPLALRKPQI